MNFFEALPVQNHFLTLWSLGLYLVNIMNVGCPRCLWRMLLAQKLFHYSLLLCSVQFSRSVVSDSLQPHESHYYVSNELIREDIEGRYRINYN